MVMNDNEGGCGVAKVMWMQLEQTSLTYTNGNQFIIS